MRALLDACVIYPTVLREVLVGCAGLGLYDALWSERILEEWARATVKLGPEAEVQARGEVAVLKAQFPNASVRPREGDILHQRHVLIPAHSIIKRARNQQPLIAVWQSKDA